jgi:hypothetical protein
MFPGTRSDILISAAQLKHFGHWDKRPDPAPGTIPDISKIANVAFSIGLWLDKSAKDVPHGVEIVFVGGR